MPLALKVFHPNLVEKREFSPYLCTLVNIWSFGIKLSPFSTAFSLRYARKVAPHQRLVHNRVKKSYSVNKYLMHCGQKSELPD